MANYGTIGQRLRNIIPCLPADNEANSNGGYAILGPQYANAFAPLSRSVFGANG